jgi:hypothetical protein
MLIANYKKPRSAVGHGDITVDGAMFDLRSRPTTEIVVLLLTILVCTVLILVILGIVILRIVHPEIDLTKSGDAIFNMVSTIIGALVGFISGRMYGNREERDKINGPAKP